MKQTACAATLLAVPFVLGPSTVGSAVWARAPLASLEDCENSCAADPLLFGGGSGTAWDVQIASVADGTSDWSTCKECAPCSAGVILTYLGSGNFGFGGNNADFQVYGNICVATVTTGCDSDNLGSIRGQSGQGSVRVDLYCTCQVH